MPKNSLLHIWDDNVLGDRNEWFRWDDHGDIIRKIGPDQKYITFVNNEWKNIKISLLDLHNIWNLSDDEISEMLRIILWTPIQSPEWLILVNELAKRALKYLKEELLYTDSELRWIWNLEFKSSSEVIKFFKGTKKSQWIQKCMLAKVWMLFQEWVGYDVEQKRQKTIDVLERKVMKNLEDLTKESSLWFSHSWLMNEFEETWKTQFTGTVYVDNITGDRPRKIEFQVEIREKSIESTISKALREKDYINQWDIMDLLWIRITTKNSEDKIILMNLISQLAFKYWEYRIKNKGWISKDDLDTILNDSEYFFRNKSTALFLKTLEESFSNLERRQSTALKYVDVKLVPIWENNKLSFEILFLDLKNTNINGLAHHKPFSYMRKIEERVRLEWFITEDALKRIAHQMIDSISKSSKVDLWGQTPTDLMREILQDVYEESHEWRDIQSREDTQTMKKQELEYELKRVMPSYYISRLTPFKDSMWQTSNRRKYTTKLWLENISVLQK